MPRPLKDKKRFEAIFITTAPKIKNSKSTFTTFYIDLPPFSPPPYDTLCMCSLTAVYINQYIYETAAAYCVCRFEWANDTKGVSMLCKKGPSSYFSSLFFPSSPTLCFWTPPFPFSFPPPRQTLCLSSNHTQVHTWHSEIPSPALLRLPPFASASCLWRTSGVVISLAFSPRPFSFFSVPRRPALFFNMGGRGVLMILIIFYFKDGRGGVWKLLFLI